MVEHSKSSGNPVVPKTFFLNEAHQVLMAEKSGGGQPARPEGVDWPAKSVRLAQAFRAVANAAEQSRDPAAKAGHLFLVALPEAEVKKAAVKNGEPTTRAEEPQFGGAHAFEFGKIGMDLLEVRQDGAAVVHLFDHAVASVEAKLTSLGDESRRNVKDEARWARFAGFESWGAEDKIAPEWLATLKDDRLVTVHIRFFPVLNKLLFRRVVAHLAGDVAQLGGVVTQTGRSNTGSFWCTAKLNRRAVTHVASTYTSVRWLHAPQVAKVFSHTLPRGQAGPWYISSLNPAQIALLPKIAVVDVGVPQAHPVLAPYFLNQYSPPRSYGSINPQHGSQVATAVVLGPILNPASAAGLPRCRFFSIDVSQDDDHVKLDLVAPAMTAARGTDQELRIFVLSFGSEALPSLGSDMDRQQHLATLAELEMFGFSHDVLLVIAAGNTLPGLQPGTAYPAHHNDPKWGLGAEASSYNGLVVGGYVDPAVPGGVGGLVGATSPFSRVGPGLLGSPLPGFGARGGDVDANYKQLAGTGVFVCDNRGGLQEVIGTSYSAPFVAREAAAAMVALKKRCRPGTEPFAATVKAFLHLSARRPALRGQREKLAKLSLGVGYPQASLLDQPDPETAVFVWQTALPQPRMEHGVQVPVPLDWLRAAKQPVLRLVCAWLTPVNDALAASSWATRAVVVHLRPFGASLTLRGAGVTRGHYPLIDRSFAIGLDVLGQKGFLVSNDPWTVAVSYTPLGPDLAGMTVSPIQRVGIVIELRDEGEGTAGPQQAIQSLSIANTMDFLPIFNSSVGVQIHVDT